MKRTAKKILSLILCVALSLGAVAVPALAASSLPGDVDGDNTVTTKDARLALRAAVGLDTLSAEKTAAADVTGDGKVETDDARVILRVAVGLMRLSEDGKRYEDLPKPGDVLADFILHGGEAGKETHRLEYTNEDGDIITYDYIKESGEFDFIAEIHYDGLTAFYRTTFSKSFTDYYADVMVLDPENLYASATYKMDPTNLNWNTGAECLTETQYSGDPSTKADLRDAVSGYLCLMFSLLLEEAQAAGYKITRNDMHLYRLMEPYQG